MVEFWLGLLLKIGSNERMVLWCVGKFRDSVDTPVF